MKKSYINTAVVISMLMIASCRKETAEPVTPFTDTASGPVDFVQKPQVNVSTIQELYEAVNNPSNAGKEITIAPGNYVLDASYPNGGRLELQTDMSLKGHPGHPGWVVIDQSSLPTNSYRLTPTISTGGIRVGRGTNSIQWLSIKGGALAANPFSVIETDLTSPVATIELLRVNIDCNGSRIGLMLRNRLDEHAGRTINAKLEHSEIKSAVNGIGFGIAIQNRISGSSVNLAMKKNFIHGNRIGLLIFNGGLTNSIENCAVNVLSNADRLEENGCGIDPSGATNGSATTTANNNTVSIKMYGSAIRNNNQPSHPELIPTNGALPGAIFAAAAYNSLNNASGFSKVSNNNLEMKFWDCDISGNNGTDIYAYGAWSQPLALLAGTNNHTSVYLYGLAANATVEASASVPAEAAGTNTVNVYRN